MVLLLLSLITNSTNGNSERKMQNIEVTRNRVFKVVALEDDFLDFENLYEYLIQINIRFPDIVLKQIAGESGWLTSYNCTNRNNLLGMRIARKRKTLAINKGTGDRWAKFQRWKDSVRDYKIWQDYAMKGVKHVKTNDQYINFIVFKRNYSVNPEHYLEFINGIKLSRTGLKKYEED